MPGSVLGAGDTLLNKTDTINMLKEKFLVVKCSKTKAKKKKKVTAVMSW